MPLAKDGFVDLEGGVEVAERGLGVPEVQVHHRRVDVQRRHVGVVGAADGEEELLRALDVVHRPLVLLEGMGEEGQVAVPERHVRVIPPVDAFEDRDALLLACQRVHCILVVIVGHGESRVALGGLHVQRPARLVEHREAFMQKLRRTLRVALLEVRLAGVEQVLTVLAGVQRALHHSLQPLDIIRREGVRGFEVVGFREELETDALRDRAEERHPRHPGEHLGAIGEREREAPRHIGLQRRPERVAAQRNKGAPEIRGVRPPPAFPTALLLPLVRSLPVRCRS
mmetsp:Transcript_32084/g.76203  ORF Transcript_32084/g.76203 Transcript_32084/m.76203 type:complete len:284 (+) Transcript_32084:503-1354(+)